MSQVQAAYKNWQKYGFNVVFDAIKCDTEQDWHDLRAKGIGGSDVAAIMGISPWTTPLQVWLEKTGREPPRDLTNNEYVYWGTVLEEKVADRFAEIHPDMTIRNVKATLVDNLQPYIHANLDRMVIQADGTPAVLEIKTANARKADEWDEGVPAYYLTQVTTYLAVTGWKRAYVACLVGGNHYVEHVIERDEDDVLAVRSACERFWEGFVKKDVMPEITTNDQQSYAELTTPDSGEFVALDDTECADAAIDAYLSACSVLKAAEHQKKEAATTLISLIGDSKGLLTDIARVTWVRSAATKLDTKRLKADHPELFEQYQKPYVRNSGIRIKEF